MSCTKCGKVGHWASQCTAPPDEWVTQGRTPAASGTQVRHHCSINCVHHLLFQQLESVKSSVSAPQAQQQQPERRATQQPPKGCFKCGKSGHWCVGDVVGAGWWNHMPCTPVRKVSCCANLTFRAGCQSCAFSNGFHVGRSRDCTAPKEDWVPRDASGNAGRTDENDAPLPGCG